MGTRSLPFEQADSVQDPCKCHYGAWGTFEKYSLEGISGQCNGLRRPDSISAEATHAEP